MGHFLDYELFTPCWHCGRTDCTGNRPEAGLGDGGLPHETKGFGHPDCGCHVCLDMREREVNRDISRIYGYV